MKENIGHTDPKNFTEELDKYLIAQGIIDKNERTRYEAINKEQAQCKGFSANAEGLLINYNTPDGEVMTDHKGRPYYRLRHNVQLEDGRRYSSLYDSGTHLFFPVNFKEAHSRSCEIIITEGEKKCSCLASIGKTAAGLAGWACWNKKGTEELHSDWELFELKGKLIYLCPDFDAIFNFKLLNELNKLSSKLYEAGAKEVRIIILPGESENKLGIDDYLNMKAPAAKVDGELVSARAEMISELMKKSTTIPEQKNALWEVISDIVNDTAKQYFSMFSISSEEVSKNLRHAAGLVSCAPWALSKKQKTASALNEVLGVTLPWQVSTADKKPVDLYYHKGITNEASFACDEENIKTIKLKATDIAFQLSLYPSVIKNVDDNLFHIKNGEAYPITGIANLIAIFDNITGENTYWKTGVGYVDKEVFLYALTSIIKNYKRISKTPEYPEDPDALYLCGIEDLPAATGKHLKQFIGFFKPSSEADVILIGAMMLSPFWSGRPKPQFVIDTIGGKGSGKSTLAYKLAKVTDTVALEEDSANLNDSSRLRRRLVGPTGRNCKIVLVDNVEGVYHSDGIAAIITSPVISDTPNHGKKEEHRVNDFVTIATMNDAVMDEDQASRSYPIMIKRYSGDISAWDQEIDAFIEQYRKNIL